MARIAPTAARDEETTVRTRERKRLVPWGSGPIVLLVEDDGEMREILAVSLRRDGYRVIEAEDGAEALDLLGGGIVEGEPQRLPDLIVSDIRLPHASGLEILEAARVAFRRVPVILVTGFGNAEAHAQARALGAVRVLDKPFALVDFLAAVHQSLRAPGRRPPWERDGHVI